MIRIKSKQKNFRRCGMAHDDQWVKHPEGRFTAEQLAILKAEPMLIVEVVPGKAAPASAPEISESTESPQAEAMDTAAHAKADESGKEPVKAGKKGRK